MLGQGQAQHLHRRGRGGGRRGGSATRASVTSSPPLTLPLDSPCPSTHHALSPKGLLHGAHTPQQTCLQAVNLQQGGGEERRVRESVRREEEGGGGQQTYEWAILPQGEGAFLPLPPEHLSPVVNRVPPPPLLAWVGSVAPASAMRSRYSSASHLLASLSRACRGRGGERL